MALAEEFTSFRHFQRGPRLNKPLWSLPQKLKGPQSRLQIQMGMPRFTGEYSTGLPIYLVDDVATTGASLGEARRQLESRGFRVQGAYVLAVHPLLALKSK